MNGAVYISFFQGQLESVLEQVVQLAVQEISKTVGSSLNALLMETAVKEKENRGLRLQIQQTATSHNNNTNSGTNNPSSAVDSGGRKKASSNVDENKGRSSKQPVLLLHSTQGKGSDPGVRKHTDTRRLEQRGRVVDQLKCVMEQVLDFAVRELTKIVEASFDDLLLEITKMEREQRTLEERLDQGDRGGSVRRRGSENDSVSPSGSEDREDLSDVTVSTTKTDGSDRPPVLQVSQDWVPILDKVFGQKWCSDVWQIKELVGETGGGGGGGGGGENNSGGRGLIESGRGLTQTQQQQQQQQNQQIIINSQSRHSSSDVVTMEPRPSSPMQDPRWTPLEDMEVFSPDEDTHTHTHSQTHTHTHTQSLNRPTNVAVNNNDAAVTTATTTTTTPGSGPQPPLSPTGSLGRRSSASMLHRLLTLPSQLLDEDQDANANTNEMLLALAALDGSTDLTLMMSQGGNTPGGGGASGVGGPVSVSAPSPAATTREEEEEEEEEEEGEDKGRKKKRRRVWSECEECGRRFSRMSLLKVHRQSHRTETSSTNHASAPSSPHGVDGGSTNQNAASSSSTSSSTTSSTSSSTTSLRCSECGKRFSSATRLHSHVRAQHT